MEINTNSFIYCGQVSSGFDFAVSSCRKIKHFFMVESGGSGNIAPMHFHECLCMVLKIQAILECD